MKPTVYRKAIVDLVLVCGLGIVAYEFGVIPAQRSVQQSALELEQLEIEKVGWGAFDDAREQLAVLNSQELLEKIESINAISVEASEPALLYNQYTQAARSAGVKIERIDPSTRTVRTGNDSQLESSGFTLTVTGRFSSVTAFIEMLQQGFDLTMVENIRMVPSGPSDDASNQESVLATIETRHYRISRPLVASLGASSEGMPR